MTPAHELVRWVVAAYMSNPSASHDERVEMLRSVGVPRAGSACVMTELAYGRQILDGLVTLPATYEIDGRELAFADHAIFVAARELARHALRAELEAIGLRSAEVNAVNQALHAGSRPEDLELGRPVLWADEDADRPLATPQPILDQMVQGHGAKLPIEVRVFPKRVQNGLALAQLDFVATDKNREIIESFGGFGATIADALKDALQKFAHSSLHVLLAVLGDRAHAGDHVEWQTWRGFEVCSGPMLRQWAQEPPIDFAALLDAIKATLPPLSRELHWFSIFIAVSEGKVQSCTVALDNQSYTAGVELVERWPWPASDQLIGLRHFFMLAPPGG